MVRAVQNITKPFSRIKNGLAELQPMWPAYIKNDGKGGLTVDPMLFRSIFGPETNSDVGLLEDVANTPGIRVEAINDDGTDVSGTEPTITITGAGTFNPRAVINDGTNATTVFLIAPSMEGKADSNPGDLYNNDPIKRDFPFFDEANTVRHYGPYPVFMTIQELAEFIDDYRHVGQSNADKPAFLPHGLIGRNYANGSAANPAHGSEPRMVQARDGDQDSLANTGPFRATVFHPMLLDVNQFSKDITGATQNVTDVIGSGDVTWSKYSDNGITRYDPDPETGDTSVVKYKVFGKSGDHLQGRLHTNYNDHDGQSNFFQSFDSTAVHLPKYRMKMALACFLKNGTYSLNDGALIPYTYDPTRFIGGTTTTTLYAVWDGKEGFGSPLDTGVGKGDTNTNYDVSDDCSAQIYPYFDFTQGPLAPSAQSNNWSNEMMTDRHTTDEAGSSEPNVLAFGTAPAPHRAEIVGLRKDGKSVEIYCVREVGDSGAELATGDPIYIEGLPGSLGTGSKAVHPNDLDKLWPDRWGERGQKEDQSRDINGWWITTKEDMATSDQQYTKITISKTSSGNAQATLNGGTINTGEATEDAGAGTGTMSDFLGAPTVNGSNYEYYIQRIRIHCAWEDNANDAVYLVPRNTAYVRMGRAGGSQHKYHSDGGTGAADSYFQIPDRDAAKEGDPSHYAVGTGIQVGVSQMDSNVPVGSSTDSTYPGRPTLGEKSIASSDGVHRDGRPVARSIHLVGIGKQNTIQNAQDQYGEGGGALRIPPPLGFDLCDRYNGHEASTLTLRADSKAPNMNGEYGHDKWAYRGVSTPLWSFTDTMTGRRAWDYIKPTGVSGTWTYGRNRCWPGHERLGTRLSASPTLLRSTDHSATWTVTTTGNNLVTEREATTKYGLSEMACSPIHLDFEMTAFFPAQQNRMVMIEFDGNEEHPHFGRHSMVTMTPARNYGFGIEPIWDGSDTQGVSWFDNSPVNVSGNEVTPDFFDPNITPYTTQPTNSPETLYAHFTHVATDGSSIGNSGVNKAGGYLTKANQNDSSLDIAPVKSLQRSFFNHTPNGAKGPFSDATFGVASADVGKTFPPTSTYNRPAIWMTAGANHLTTSGSWTNQVPENDFTLPGTGGFGRLGNRFGSSDYFSFSEGTHTLRTLFNSKGMTFIWNGDVVGTDRSCAIPVWNMSIKMCDLTTMPIRTPLVHGSVAGDMTTMNTGKRDYNISTRNTFGKKRGAQFLLRVDNCDYSASLNKLTLHSADLPTDQTVVRNVLEGTSPAASSYNARFFINGNTAYTFTSFQTVSGELVLNDCVPVSGSEQADATGSLTVYIPLDRSQHIHSDYTPAHQLSTTTLVTETAIAPYLPAAPTFALDSRGEITRLTNPTLQKSNQDLQIDSMTMRHLPTPAMLPFTVDTVKQQPSTTVAKYNNLYVTAENIDTTKGMDVRVTLLEPPTVATIDQEASTVITGFDDVALDFVGGQGILSLADLPSSAITNGFVIRFLFSIPSTEETALHPIDWSAIPIIRSWEIDYDEKPTVDVAVITNSFDGTTATSVGSSDTSFTTKIGHIITYRVTGATTDTAKTITHFKVEYGDATDSGWVEVTTPATSISQDISHVYATTGGTNTVKAYVKDSAGNESVASDPSITYTITNAAPVAVLKAIPSMVRAGQAIRFDGTSSYSINTSATLSTYTFSFGDGSSDAASATAYNDHTYADAGEYQATLTVTDSNGTTSATAKVVVKVLPATLVVPLTLNTKPSGFRRRRSASLTQTPVLDAIYPEVTDSGQRGDEFELSGLFLKATENTDIEFMEELLHSGALVEFEWEAVNYSGTETGKTFVGRMISFDYERTGGNTGQTPYTAVFVREAGLGV